MPNTDSDMAPQFLSYSNAVRALAALLVFMIAQGCGSEGTEATDAPTPEPGRLVIVGGALQAENAEVYATVVEARAGDGPLCVIPTASSDAPEAMAGAAERLSSYGGAGSATGVLLSTSEPERARDPAVAAELSECSGFYFTGGSQSRILDVFLPDGDTTVAYRALWQRWREGAVVAGSSAGAAMMSRVMISGGGSDEAVAVGVASAPDADGVQLRPGMGFFDPILDQHFLARGRIGRLVVAVIDADSPAVGFGIDENTALVVDGESARVVGASGVVVVDGRNADVSGPNRASEVRVSLAGSGDVIDLGSLDVRRADAKSPLPVEEGSLREPDDPFARWAFLHLIHDLASTSATEAVFDVGGSSFRITEAADFAASYSEAAGGVQETPRGLSAGPFRVDLSAPGS